MKNFWKKKHLSFFMTIFLQQVLCASGSNFSVTSTITKDWKTGYEAVITIKNNGTEPSSSWGLTFDVGSSDQVIQNLWNGQLDTKKSLGVHAVVSNPSWTNGGVIKPGGSVAVGMIVNKNRASLAALQNVVFTPVVAGSTNSTQVSSSSGTIPALQSTLSSSQPINSSVSSSINSQTVPTSQDYKALQTKIWAALLNLEKRYDGTVVEGLLVDDQGDKLHSEGIGYGMIIAVGNNDKAAFLKNVNFMAARLDKFGLMNWNVNKDGSITEGYNGHYAATDADLDILYGLIQGLIQWPDLCSQQVKTTMIGFDDVKSVEMVPVSQTITMFDLARQQLYTIWDLEVNHTNDPVTNYLLLPGDGFGPRPFGKEPYNKINVSYIRPTYMTCFQNFFTKFMSSSSDVPPLYNSSGYNSGTFNYATQKQDWNAVKNKMYDYTLLTMQKTNLGLPPAWADPVTAVPGGMTPDFQYDAVRILQFAGMDYQQDLTNEKAKKILQQILGFYGAKLVSSGKNAQGQNTYSQFTFPVSLSSGSSASQKWMTSIVLPPVDLMYRFPAVAGQEGSLCCNPSNPMIAVSLMIAAHAMGSSYLPIERTCFDYLMSKTDGAVTKISYFAGSLTVMAAQFLNGTFPSVVTVDKIVPSSIKSTSVVQQSSQPTQLTQSTIPQPNQPTQPTQLIIPPVNTSPLKADDYAKLQTKIFNALMVTESKYNGTVTAGLLVDDYGDKLHSEGVGYGMLIAVGNNDKATFLKNFNFMAARLDKFALMNWNINTDGSIVPGYAGHYAAADADLDIAYACIAALKKWPDIATQQVIVKLIGYDDTKNAESAPITKTMTILDVIKQQMYSIWDLEINHTNDPVTNFLVLPGDGFGGRPFSKDTSINVSYFRPTYTQAFQDFYTTYLKGNSAIPPLYSSSCYKSGSFPYSSQIHDWVAVKNKMYTYTFLNLQQTNLGLPSAWSNPVTGVPGGGDMNFQYDAVRVFQFIGMDYMQTGNTQAKQILQQMLGYYCYGLQSNKIFFPLPVTLSAGLSANQPWVKNVILPVSGMSYQSGYNPGNPMIAVSLMIAAHAMGGAYKSLEQTCYDYLMSSDSGVTKIPYFAGALTVMAAQFLAGVFP